MRIPWNALTLVLALTATGIAERRWIDTQADAAVVLAVTLEAPVLRPIVEAVTAEPVEEDGLVAGVPALVVRPGGDGPWPAVVFVNGATRRGRHHPTVRRLAHGLARAGFVAVVPDPPGLTRGEITVRTSRAVVAVTRATRARHGRVALLGVSVGASLALLAASEVEVGVVAGLAPYADLRGIIRLATTGRVDPFVRLVVGRSLAAALPPGPDRRRLVAQMRAVPWESEAPLAALRRSPDDSPLVRLLVNRDPRRFARLYAALPASLRSQIRLLSPLARARRIDARVELASAPEDKYFPLSESRALVRAAPDARLTVTKILRHAVPDPSPRGVADIARLDAFAARVLRLAG